MDFLSVRECSHPNHWSRAFGHMVPYSSSARYGTRNLLTSAVLTSRHQPPRSPCPTVPRGGSGIGEAPVSPGLLSCQDVPNWLKWRHVSEGRFIFRRELVRFYLLLDCLWPNLFGAERSSLMSASLPLVDRRPLVYVCGPAGFIVDATTRLFDAGVQSSRPI